MCNVHVAGVREVGDLIRERMKIKSNTKIADIKGECRERMIVDRSVNGQEFSSFDK